MSNAHRFAARSQPCIELPDDAVVALLRRKTPAERLAMVFDAERTMRLVLEAHLRWRHPEWDDEQVAREIARRRNLEPS
jgi:hypothetical protein